MGNSEVKTPETPTPYDKTPSKDPVNLNPELEEKLKKLGLKDPQMICSSSGKKITKLCLNPKCKDSLRCS